MYRIVGEGGHVRRRKRVTMPIFGDADASIVALNVADGNSVRRHDVPAREFGSTVVVRYDGVRLRSIAHAQRDGRWVPGLERF